MNSTLPANPAGENATLDCHEDDILHRKRRHALVASLSAAACDSVNGESLLETARRRLRRVVKAGCGGRGSSDAADVSEDFETVIRSVRRRLRPADSRPLPVSREPPVVDPEDEAALLGLPDFAYLLQLRLKELKPAQETPAWIKQAIAAAATAAAAAAAAVAATAAVDSDSQATSDVLESVSAEATAVGTAVVAVETTSTMSTNKDGEVKNKSELVDTEAMQEVPKHQQECSEKLMEFQQQHQDVEQDARLCRILIEERCRRILQGLEDAFNDFQTPQPRKSRLVTGVQICCDDGAGELLANGEENQSTRMPNTCQMLVNDSTAIVAGSPAAGTFALTNSHSLPSPPAATSASPSSSASSTLSGEADTPTNTAAATDDAHLHIQTGHQKHQHQHRRRPHQRRPRLLHESVENEDVCKDARSGSSRDPPDGKEEHHQDVKFS